MNSILLVEDNESDALLLRLGFDRAGWEGALMHVRSVGAAMDYILGNGSFADRESYPMPDLILTDWHLGNSTGETFLNWLRQSPGRHIPAVVLSSSNEPEIIALAYQAGANSYHEKRHDFTDIQELCGFLQNYWGKFNRASAPNSSRCLS